MKMYLRLISSNFPLKAELAKNNFFYGIKFKKSKRTRRPLVQQDSGYLSVSIVPGVQKVKFQSEGLDQYDW